MDFLVDPTAHAFFWNYGFCWRIFLAVDVSNGVHDLNLSPQRLHREISRFCGAILKACRGQVGTQRGNGLIQSSALVCSLY